MVFVAERFNAIYTHALKFTRSARELIDRFVKTPTASIDPRLPRIFAYILFVRYFSHVKTNRKNQSRKWTKSNDPIQKRKSFFVSIAVHYRRHWKYSYSYEENVRSLTNFFKYLHFVIFFFSHILFVLNKQPEGSCCRLCIFSNIIKYRRHIRYCIHVQSFVLSVSSKRYFSYTATTHLRSFVHLYRFVCTHHMCGEICIHLSIR